MSTTQIIDISNRGFLRKIVSKFLKKIIWRINEKQKSITTSFIYQVIITFGSFIYSIQYNYLFFYLEIKCVKLSDMEVKPHEKAKSVVFEFVNQMNDWETKMYIFSRITNQQFVSKQDQQLVSEYTEESLNLLYYTVLKDFCTNKKRVYGGNPYSFGKPTKYSGINDKNILETTQIKPNRIEVIAESTYFSKTIYLFVLLKTKAKWKIDSVKIKSGNKWRNSLL